MKSPILILVIIFNLLAINFASANSEFDEETVEAHLLQNHEGSAHNHTDAKSVTSTVNTDKSSCDHCCHISAHMMGFITRISTVSIVGTSFTFNKFSEQLSSLAIAPPYHPPQA